MSIDKLQTIILSGGSGTRLWPLSREKHPKQLLSLSGGGTLLQDTVLRSDGLFLDGIEVSKRPLIISNHEYRFTVAEQLRQLQLEADILLEPCARGTASALTAAAQWLAMQQQDAIMLVMPSDHKIEDVASFQQAVVKGIRKAQDGSVVCFGIRPAYPEDGYGYIKVKQQADNGDLMPLDQFVEKPSIEMAQAYVTSGEYYWNSGIFMLKVSTWLQAIAEIDPITQDACKRSVEQARRETDFIWLNQEAFAQARDDSIDYAVMETLGEQSAISAYVSPLDAGWSDVGTWNAVWQESTKNTDGNVIRGRGSIVSHLVTNSLLHAADRRVVAVLGLDDVVVVDTADAVLVAAKKALPELRSLIGVLKHKHPEVTERWREVFRPWGSYDVLTYGERYKVKHVFVKPGGSLSLQKHKHRSEHWVVIKGKGLVTLDDKVFELERNHSVYIPLGAVHRLENPYTEDLELIEVQSGLYVGEDDIIRIKDIYGRDDT